MMLKLFLLHNKLYNTVIFLFFIIMFFDFIFDGLFIFVDYAVIYLGFFTTNNELIEYFLTYFNFNISNYYILFS